jgi:hypothetical protein
MPFESEGDSVPLEEPFPANETTSSGSGDLPTIEELEALAASQADASTREETRRSNSPTEDGQPLPQFDPKHRTDFDGLLYIGALSDEFRQFGHHFKIRTLSNEDLLTVALAHQKYRGTMGEERAYVTAMVAACLVSVDKKEMPEPLGGMDDPLAARLDYVNGWFPWTTDAVYQRYLVLEARVIAVIEAMGKVQGSASLTPGSNASSG